MVINKEHTQHAIYDVAGIGIGPSNLSLAALLQPTSLSAIFFDSVSQFNWHPGMKLKASKLQVHFLKDCVSLVDPTNPYSFLNYLVKSKRIYSFINRKTESVSRKEYNSYYSWVVSRLNNLHFSHTVQSVQLEGELFKLTVNNKIIYSKNVVCSVGLVPYIPEEFKSLLSEDVFYTKDYLLNKNNIAGKRIAVVGGGQSSAEVVHDLISENPTFTEINWAFKQLYLQPNDDSCFANDFFTPNYCQLFYGLSSDLKEKLISEQLHTSDGISKDLIDSIYRQMYEDRYVNNSPHHYTILAHHELIEIKNTANGYQLYFNDIQLNSVRCVTADKIIFATGYRPIMPDLINPLQPILQYEKNGLAINYDYSVKLSQSISGAFYLGNLARHSHGIAEQNLSLIAWRNSKIINSIMKQEYYPSFEDTVLVNSKTNDQTKSSPSRLNFRKQISEVLV